MIDGPNGVLMGVPRPVPQDSAPALSPASAPSAQEVSAAYQVVTQSLKGKTLDAQNLAAAEAEARRYTQLHDRAIAEAELAVIAQYDAQHRQAGPVQAGGMYAQAARRLKAGSAFDEATRDAAQHALESGDLRIDPHQTVASFNPAVCGMGDSKPLPVALKDEQGVPSLDDATNRLNAYIASGMSLQEAVGMVRVENGANPAAEDVLARAALATQAPSYVNQYVQHPDGADPVGLASEQIAKLGLFASDTLAHATQAMTIALPEASRDSDAVSAAREVEAAQKAEDKLAHDTPGSAGFAADMATYRSVLEAQLKQAAGKDSTAWFNDTSNVDAWLKAEVAVANENLAPLSDAAVGKPDTAPEQKALKDAEHRLNLALEETRVVADVGNVGSVQQQTATSDAQRAQIDISQTQRLTSDLSALGLMNFDGDAQRWIAAKNSGENPDASTMLTDILDDSSIKALKQHDIDDVMQYIGTTGAQSSEQAKADLRATSNALAPFKQGGSTVFYGDMLDTVQGSASLKQRFDDIASSVHDKGAVSYVHDVAHILQDVSMPGDADLTRALYQEKFRSRFESFVAHGTWDAPSGLSSLWDDMDAPKYYVDTSNVYAALGDTLRAASQTQQGAALMSIVKTRMDGSHFVGQTYEGSVTKGGPDEKIKSYYLNWKDKHGQWNGNAQLFQDIAQQAPRSDTTRFIEAELPIEVDAQDAPGASAPAYEPPDSTMTPSGTQVITSRTQLIDVLGAAFHAKPMDHAGQNGARYDGAEKIYGNTTLNDLAQATLASQHMSEPSVGIPLELTLLPIRYWRQDQDPRKDDPQELQLVQVDGAHGRRFVGPAGGQSFATYNDWTRRSGFGAGLMCSTQHILQTASGRSQLWDQTITGQKRLSNGEILMQAGEAMAGMGAMAIVSFVGPEAEGIFLPLLYDASQTYFAVTGIKGAWDAATEIAKDPTSVSAWAEGGWVVAANSFTALSIASHFGMTRLPSMLEHAFEAGQAAQGDVGSLSLPARLLVSAADNAAGAKTYMGLAGAPDAILAAQRAVLKGAALTNGVLFAAQGVQLGAAWTKGQAVSPGAVMQFLATIGMGQFGRLYHLEYATSAPSITTADASTHIHLSADSARAFTDGGSAKQSKGGGATRDGNASQQATSLSLENERLAHIEVAADGRSAALTMASGAIVLARMLGARGLPPPRDAADLFLPGCADTGQRLQLLSDPDTGKHFIVPRVRGAATDEDPQPGVHSNDAASEAAAEEGNVSSTLPARVRWSKSRVRPSLLTTRQIDDAGVLLDLRDDERFLNADIGDGDSFSVMRGRGTEDSRVYGVEEFVDDPLNAVQLLTKQGSLFDGMGADRSIPLVVAVANAADRLAPELANLLQRPTIAPASARDIDSEGNVFPDARFVCFDPAPYRAPKFGTLDVRNGRVMRLNRAGEWVSVQIEECIGPFIGADEEKAYFEFGDASVLELYGNPSRGHDDSRAAIEQARQAEARARSIGLKVTRTSAALQAYDRIGSISTPKGYVGSNDAGFYRRSFPASDATVRDVKAQAAILARTPAELGYGQFVLTDDGAYLAGVSSVEAGVQPSQWTLDAIARVAARVEEMAATRPDVDEPNEHEAQTIAKQVDDEAQDGHPDEETSDRATKEDLPGTANSNDQGSHARDGVQPVVDAAPPSRVDEGDTKPTTLRTNLNSAFNSGFELDFMPFVRKPKAAAWADPETTLHAQPLNPTGPIAMPFSESEAGMPHLVMSDPQHYPLLSTFDTYRGGASDFVVGLAVRDGQVLDATGRPVAADELAFQIVASRGFKGKSRVVLLADGDVGTVAPGVARMLRGLRVPVLAHGGPLRGTGVPGHDGWRVEAGEDASSQRESGDAILDLGNFKVAVLLQGGSRVATVPRNPQFNYVLGKEQGVLRSLRADGIPVLDTQRGVYMGRPALFASRYAASWKEVARWGIADPRDPVTARALMTVLRERGVPLDSALLESIRRIRSALVGRRVRITDFDVFFGKVGEDGRIDGSAVVADPASWESGAPFEHDLRSLDWLSTIVETATTTAPADRAPHEGFAPNDLQAVVPGVDGRSVKLIDRQGGSISAVVLGGRAGLPTSRDDILTRGDVPRGQRFQAIVDPEDATWVVLRRI